MTEYEEICNGKSITELYKELQYQINELGYDIRDSFPSYLVNRINKLKNKNMKMPPANM
jgi:hypothetical protein